MPGFGSRGILEGGGERLCFGLGQAPSVDIARNGNADLRSLSAQIEYLLREAVRQRAAVSESPRGGKEMAMKARKGRGGGAGDEERAEAGRLVSVPYFGGLHHGCRRAA